MLPRQVLLLSACALVAGAWPAQASPPPRFEWPTPGLIEQVEVPGFIRNDGLPMKLKAVRLARPVQQVVDLYVDAYRRAGLYIPPPRYQVEITRELTVSAFDPRRFISYTAIFQPNKDGTTTVVLGEANLALRSPNGPPPFAPLYPGATDLVRSDSEGANLLAYAVNAAPAKVSAFYRDALGREGYQPEPDAPTRFWRPGEELAVQVFSEGKQGTRVLLIQRRRASLPEASPAPPDAGQGPPRAP